MSNSEHVEKDKKRPAKAGHSAEIIVINRVYWRDKGSVLIALVHLILTL